MSKYEKSKYRTKRNNKNNKTRRNNKSGFQEEITVKFLEMLLLIKLYHWKTMSFATHKATDELYTKLNANMDSFVEILLGKTGIRTNFTNKKQIRLADLNTHDKSLQKEIEKFKEYLITLDNTINKITVKNNTDLLNIRDTILGDLNQFLYLLTFK